jgi:tol-pal system beta propeller repeat protein TolB
VTAAPHRAAAATPDKIVFSRVTGSSVDITVVNVDGTNPVDLSHNGDKNNLDYFPAWSPDGTRIAFQRLHVEPVSSATAPKSHNQIYVMNADGSSPVNLTDDPQGDYYSPAWSPDGQRLVYVSSEGDNRNYDIYVMNTDSSNPARISDRYGLNVSPVWSPDGKSIAFVSDRAGKAEIYVMGADGSNPTRLTTTPGTKQISASPDWSPDGRHITFVSNRDGNMEIYVMNADGSNPIRLTNTPDSEAYPRWSPDGRLILFMVVGKDSNQIDVMNADGSNRVQVAEGFGPAWVVEGAIF